MPVTTTYPGIYIEELPSNAHSITAAPTSITVFVGYTHPFKTASFGTAVEIFNFTDYERAFGGLYASGEVQNHVAYAVNQFFLNGGSHAYVVGLQPSYHGPALGEVVPATAQIGNIVFTAREPTDLVPMRVTVNNLKASDTNNPNNLDIADVVIAYGPPATGLGASRVETYRGITIRQADSVNFIEARIGTDANPLSSLVTVAHAGGGYGLTIPPAAPGSTVAQGSPATFTTNIAAFTTTFSAADFSDVFEESSSLDKVHVFNLILVPGVADNGVWSAALAFAERRRAFAILDPPREDVADPDPANVLTSIYEDVETNGIVPPSQNAAFYFPYLRAIDPLTGDPNAEFPPSGYVAGVYSRTDLSRGVWKAPAGLETALRGTTGVVERGRMTDMRQGTLNPIGVNCLRTLPGVGTVVFGARTVVTANPAFEQWRYVPVRRMALFLEQSLYDSLGWAVFEPNDEPLWFALRTTVTDFMLSLFNQGAFQGRTPSQAFRVQCDGSTTTQRDIDQGIVNIIVAFAPLKPAEFVVIKIAQLAGQAQS
jgi:uncharacterized protein